MLFSKCTRVTWYTYCLLGQGPPLESPKQSESIGCRRRSRPVRMRARTEWAKSEDKTRSKDGVGGAAEAAAELTSEMKASRAEIKAGQRGP